MTQKKQVKKSKMSVGKVVAVGAGVAALGAGAYYFLGPEGKKNQKKAKVWMKKIEKESKPLIKKAKKIIKKEINSVKKAAQKKAVRK